MAPVTVSLYGILNRYLPDGQRTAEVELHEPSTAGAVMEQLGVPLGMLSLLLHNGRKASPDIPVSEGDTLEAFPVCGGGERRS